MSFWLALAIPCLNVLGLGFGHAFYHKKVYGHWPGDHFRSERIAKNCKGWV